MKPTLEELQTLSKSEELINQQEYQRINLAIDLNICPNCGEKIKQSFLGYLFDYIKCNNCKKSFPKIDLDNTYL